MVGLSSHGASSLFSACAHLVAGCVSLLSVTSLLFAF